MDRALRGKAKIENRKNSPRMRCHPRRIYRKNGGEKEERKTNYLVVMVSVPPDTVPLMPSVFSRLAGT